MRETALMCEVDPVREADPVRQVIMVPFSGDGSGVGEPEIRDGSTSATPAALEAIAVRAAADPEAVTGV